MALTPEVAPVYKADPSMKPASDIQPQVGVWVDAAGFTHRAYMAAYQNSAGQPVTAPGAGSPTSFAAATKSDTVALPAGTSGLWVGGVGNVAVKGLTDSTAVTFLAVPAGTLLRGQFSFLMSTNTTATNIIALIG